jgi:hypothetical protein
MVTAFTATTGPSRAAPTSYNSFGSDKDCTMPEIIYCECHGWPLNYCPNEEGVPDVD